MSNQESNQESIEEIFLPAVQSEEVKLTLIDNEYSIVNLDDFIARLDALDEMIDNYEYKEEDRKSITKLKAATNNYIKKINDEIKAMEKSLFDNVKDQKTLINTRLNNISKKLALGLDEDNRKYKAEKLETIKAAFEDAKKSFAEFKDSDLEFYHIEQASWLNRTVTLNKVFSEIDERLNTLKSLHNLNNVPTQDLEVLTDALKDTNWNGLQALDLLVENAEAEKVRLEKLEIERLYNEEKERQKEQEKLDKAKRLEEVEEDITIQIKADDWLKAESVLKMANINFKKL